MDFFATAAKGTEPALRDELIHMHIGRVRADRGGVHFTGSLEGAYKACLYSRIALRVFLHLRTFEALDEDGLYDGIRSMDWDEHLSPSHTLAITAWCRDSALTHTNYVAQKAKDAIVDQQRDRHGKRSSVDRKDADVPIFVHLVKNQATIYLDLAGQSLHRRGYRRRSVDAPLKENLAAACIRLAGWDRKSPFCDPMCGSGTLAIEAWQWSRNIAPGLSRKRFAFERWPSFDSSARKYMSELREQARADEIEDGPEIFASDLDHKAVMASEINAVAARAKIILDKKSVLDLAPLSPPGFVISNPPYGQRLMTDREFYGKLGRKLRTLSNHKVALLLIKESMERDLGLRRDKFQIMFNGDIRFRLTMFTIKHGKNKVSSKASWHKNDRPSVDKKHHRAKKASPHKGSSPKGSSPKGSSPKGSSPKKSSHKRSPWDEVKRGGHKH